MDYDKTPNEAEQGYIDLVKERTGETPTQEDAREACANIVGFFKVIQKWDTAYKLKQSQEQNQEQVPEPKSDCN